MPILATSSYQNCEFVLNRIRLILDDSEVQGGDVITDTAPYTFVLLNAAFERVQIELASYGVETYTKEAWMIGIPSVPTIDPEARVVIDDSGCNIIYPNGVGNLYSLVPQLPPDLVYPLKCWERQNATSNFTGPAMAQPNGGLYNKQQTQSFTDWQWLNDGIYLHGATQVNDLKIRYEKQMQQLVAPTDPVPIRGVTNSAAYFAAKIFAESRGGAISPAFAKDASDEIMLLQMTAVRRKQHKQSRRKPYSGRGGRNFNGPII